MTNVKHLATLKRGIEVWNKWRRDNRDVTPELSAVGLGGANLSKANLSGANLSWADLKGADLTEANLSGADLQGVFLSGANLSRANLFKANLFKSSLDNTHLGQANLRGANLGWANLTGANLIGADVREVDLRLASLIRTDLSEAILCQSTLSLALLIGTDFSSANLTGCNIYGISIWDAKLDGAIQKDLVITSRGQSEITVDNIEIAQFIYLLIQNEKIRDVIDTIGKKAVLILGRFTPKRKAVLNALREKLREFNYIPIVFDFEKPATQDLTETVVTLAHLSKFVIADLTLAKSITHEMTSFLPHVPSVAVVPIIKKGQKPHAMFDDWYRRCAWLLPVHEYESQETLLAELVDKIIIPAEEKVKQLRPGSAG